MLSILNAAWLLGEEGVRLPEKSNTSRTSDEEPETELPREVDFQAIIAGLDFVFAKTMPQSPHWYTVRSVHNETAYYRLFETIKAYGRVEPYGKARYRYLYPGDGYKYWAMTSDARQSRIINRARVAPEPTAP